MDSFILVLLCFLNILTVMGETATEKIGGSHTAPKMEKIGESSWSELEGIDSYHTILVDRKIWIFSKKYVAQKTYNWGHYITFQGGYSAYFSLESKQWSQKVSFPALRDDENMEEFLFVLNSHIFLLLFSQWGGITFKHLYIWNETKRNWDEHKAFKIDPNCDKNVGGVWITHIIAVDQDQPSNATYFISSNSHSTRYYQISLDNTDAKLSLLHEIISHNAMHRRPVKAARANGKIYWLEGVDSCGFHIEPEILKGIDTKTNKIEEHQIEGGRPPFDFVGSKCTSVLPSGQWIHATGFTSFGMTNSKFCGEVWSINIKDSKFAWKKLDFEVPESDRMLLVVVPEDGVLYAIQPVLGILKGNLTLT